MVELETSTQLYAAAGLTRLSRYRWNTAVRSNFHRPRMPSCYTITGGSDAAVEHSRQQPVDFLKLLAAWGSCRPSIGVSSGLTFQCVVRLLFMYIYHVSIMRYRIELSSIHIVCGFNFWNKSSKWGVSRYCIFLMEKHLSCSTFTCWIFYICNLNLVLSSGHPYCHFFKCMPGLQVYWKYRQYYCIINIFFQTVLIRCKVDLEEKPGLRHGKNTSVF